MNISQFGMINQSRSQDSTPPHFRQSEHRPVYSSIGVPAPENGGMLKRAMRFEYQFSTPRLQPMSAVEEQQSEQKNVRSFMVNSPVRMQQSKRENHPQPSPAYQVPKRQSSLFSANIFSCMDTPDYQRDFQLAPRILQKNYD